MGGMRHRPHQVITTHPPSPLPIPHNASRAKRDAPPIRLTHALLATGCDVGQRNSLHRSLLHVAAGGGHVTTLALLIRSKVRRAARVF